jgi:branched-chain amino acid transport system ATP-binding protein
MTLLETTGLSVTFGGLHAVEQVDISIQVGGFVGLIGPNGVGKTTMLSAISGLLPIIAGSITLLGAPVDDHAPYKNARRGVAHVSDDRSLFSDLTVRENLRLGLSGNKSVRAEGLEDNADELTQRRDLLEASYLGEQAP